MKIEIEFTIEGKEDGPEMTHNTSAIVKKLLADSTTRQIQTLIEKEIVFEQGYRASLIELLESHKQAI